MKVTRNLIISALLACSLTTSAVSLAAVPTQPGEAPPELQGMVDAFGILSDDLQNQFGFKCEPNQNHDMVVTDVTPGTPAADAGLMAGDRITDCHLDKDVLDIGIERDGQTFRSKLNAKVAEQPKVQVPLVSQQAKLDQAQQKKPFTLNAEQFQLRDEKDNLRLKRETGAKTDNAPKKVGIDTSRFALQAKKLERLSDYTVELLVDRSKSMHQNDCPGGLSRWQWCGQQAASLANSLAPYAPKGLTIVPFATEYDVFEHATSRSINYLFNSIHLQLGTRLYEPLAQRIDSYFKKRQPDSKPLLIVVVTDGVPFPRFEPMLVRNLLIATSRRMTSPSDVTVIFCQIGNDDPKGAQYLHSLDENLVAEGARYHFVHTISFDDVQSGGGLGQVLSAAIKRYAPGLGGSPQAVANRPSGFQDYPNMRRPDMFVDNPQNGADGVVHFGNEKHFDLVQMSVDQAVDISNEPNPIAMQLFRGGGGGGGGQFNNNPMRQRQRVMRGNNFNNFNEPF